MKSERSSPVIIEPVIDLTGEMILAELHTSAVSSLGKRAIAVLEGMTTPPRGLIIYRSSEVREIDDARVIIDNYEFHSPTLAALLSEGDLVHPHVVSTGKRAPWPDITDDPLTMICRDTVDSLVLKGSLEIFGNIVKPLSHHPLSYAHPGSISDWDVAELGNLFSLLGLARQGGMVSLSEFHIMNPLKTTAGIAFHSPRHFVNCMCCTRENCIHRRADYRGASVDSGRQS